MADDTQNGTLRGFQSLGTKSVPTGNGHVVILDSVVTVTAAASAGSTYTMFRIPSNARIRRGSVVQFGDLASTGSPTFDFGLKAVDANITTDVDALNDGVDVYTAAGSAALVKTHGNWGKEAWEFVANQTTDPGGLLDVIITILDADTNTGGSVSATIVYNVD